jgi:SAM-dependent methyltransferase
MRLETIQSIKKAHSQKIPACESDDISDYLHGKFTLRLREQFKRKVVRAVAPIVLRLQQAHLRALIKTPLPDNSLICLEERFGDDASKSALLQSIAPEKIKNVLIPGCFLAGEDVQFWMRRGINKLVGIDINNLTKRWRDILPLLKRNYGCEIQFQQAPIEALPFDAGTFDLISSNAVLEHVQNCRAMCAETARVLRPGGWAWHSFGPLYYCYSGDHCIGAYGVQAGYDHLLLDEALYQTRIWDQAFYDTQPDPNCVFWARKEQFSYATPLEYLDLFSELFFIRHLVVKVSSQALDFRRQFPEKWPILLRSGVKEEQLLIKGLSLILQKK